MEPTIFIGQDGNGGAAVKSGNHSSQKSGGSSSGGGGASAAIEAAKAEYKDESGKKRLLSDVGSNLTLYPDEVATNGAKADPAMVSQFSKGLTNTTPALVVQTGPDQYKPIDPASAKIVASANASGTGTQRLNVIVVNNDARQIAAAKAQQKHQAKGSIPFGNTHKPAGALGHARYGSFADMQFKGGSRKGYTQKDVDKAALATLRGGARTWAPVSVKHNGGDNYSVIGSRFSLEVAQRAGIRPWIYVDS